MPSNQKRGLPESWEYVVEGCYREAVDRVDLALLAAFQDSEEAYGVCVSSARANALIKPNVQLLDYLIREGHVPLNSIGPAREPEYL